ncbi:MAG: preprotein translocase subunit SecE [Caldisericia bacterium]|jgi:preprotein translocase SecE subunit|nr:preprotein translocase subunit SecE [Caldisericia bacterium]
MSEKKSLFQKIKNFLKDVKTEFVNRTTWPSKDRLLNSFITILIFIIFWAILIGVFDIVFAQFLKFITSI